ncbi:MAG: YcaO-like family protein [Patescibacteria group bacterium]
MPVEKEKKLKKDKKLELLIQKRSSKRSYVFDYHAFIKNVITNENDLFGEGGGLSINPEEAKIRAIGETIERYCGSHINKKIKKASYDCVKKNAINPRELIYFSDSQYCNDFPYKKFNQKKQIGWVTGFSLTKKNKILLPAFAVYLGYNRLISKDEYFAPSSSCGLASHVSIEKAKNNSIFELIERDAAMITWLYKKRVSRIDINSIKSNKFIYLRDLILEEGLKMEICVTPNHFSVLSVVAIIYDPKKQIPYVSFGMAAGLNIENVVIKSLEEALMVRNTLEILKKQKKIKKIRKTDIKNYIDHAIYYSLPSRKKMWQFFLDGPVISAESLGLNFCTNDNCKKLINIFKKNNQEVIFVNLTTKLIKEMGFYCVRIIIPSLRPMDFNYNTRFLRDLKNPSLYSKINELNNNPHPFA